MYSCTHEYSVPAVPEITYLDLNQEGDSFSAIEQSVIVSECEVHHLCWSARHIRIKGAEHTGRISILPLTAIGRSLMACRPSTAVWGRLMI